MKFLLIHTVTLCGRVYFADSLVHIAIWSADGVMAWRLSMFYVGLELSSAVSPFIRLKFA